MTSLLKAAVVGVGLVTACAPAQAADTIAISYVASTSGAPVLKANLEARLDGENYSASFNGKTTGVTNLLSKYKIGLAVSGNIADSKLKPARFTKSTSKKKKDKFADLSFGAGGGMTLVTQDGPQQETEAVIKAAKGKAVDPLTALLRLAIAQGAEGAKPCSGTYRFYDGRDVGDLVFSLVKASGSTYHCNMALKSIAGRNVEDNDAETVTYGIWLAAVPVGNSVYYMPARVTGKYTGLTVSVDATGVSVNGAGVALNIPD